MLRLSEESEHSAPLPQPSNAGRSGTIESQAISDCDCVNVKIDGNIRDVDMSILDVLHGV